MRVLLICWGNSAYIKRYIERVCIPNNLEVTIYTDPIKNEEVLKYYLDNNVTIISNEFGSSFFYKIPKIRGALLLFRDALKLKNNGPYDFCHIQGVTESRYNLARILSSSYKKLLISFWGSDLLAATKKNFKMIEKGIKASTKVTLSTVEMKDKFSNIFGNKYDEKIVFTSFPTTVLEEIDSLALIESSLDIKNKLEFPTNKIIIVCGYNASERQKHLRQLNQLSKLEDTLKSQIFLVIPMMYGGSREYIEKVRTELDNINIVYKVITKYFNESDMARLWRVTDIFIHTQPTDGFSSSLRENLFANTIVINGKWLEYQILEDINIFDIKLERFEDLNDVLTNIVYNFDFYFDMSSENKNKINSLYSIQNEYEKWSDLYLQ